MVLNSNSNLTEPIANFDTLRNSRELLLHPNRTQIFISVRRSICSRAPKRVFAIEDAAAS